MRLTYRQIEFFKAIMERGTITDAAQALFVSQPAVSKALSALEAEMGFPLFVRSKTGLMPTFEARAFYTEVARSFSGLDVLSDVARELKEMKHGRLVVGVIPALSTRWLPLLAARFLQAHPEVKFTFEAYSSPQIAQMVGQGRLDIGIAQPSTRDPAIRRTELFALDVAAVMESTHRLAAKAVITPEDLAGENLVNLSRPDVIRRQLEGLLANRGVDVSRRLEVALGSTLCRLVEQGVGIGLVDVETLSNYRSESLVARRFQPHISMPISLLQSTRRPASQLEHRFAAYAVEHAPAALTT
jgi:Transcriptional regulator